MQLGKILWKMTTDRRRTIAPEGTDVDRQGGTEKERDMWKDWPVVNSSVLVLSLCPRTLNCGSCTSGRMPTDLTGPSFHTYAMSFTEYPSACRKKSLRFLTCCFHFSLTWAELCSWEHKSLDNTDAGAAKAESRVGIVFVPHRDTQNFGIQKTKSMQF